MATITINIPDAQVPRVVDALCLAGHYDPESGVTRNAFAKAEVARLIRERVVAIEKRQAELALAAPAEPDVS